MTALVDINRVHPLADLIPPMSQSEFAELRASIGAAGSLRVPIILHTDGRIIDGRHRARACAELGIVPATETFRGTERECLQLVLDLNLHRRHLTESQRALAASRLATLDRGRPGNASIEAITQDEAAAKLLVGRSAVQRARIVLERTEPEIVEAVVRPIPNRDF